MSKGSLFSSPSLAGIIPRLLNDGHSDCCHVIRLPFLPFYSFLFLKPIKHQHLGQSLWEIKTSFLILVCVKIPLPAFILVQFCCSVGKSCLTLCDPVDSTPEAPLSIGFSRQEYWSGLLFPSPGGLPHSGIEPTSAVSPALAGGFFNY